MARFNKRPLGPQPAGLGPRRYIPDADRLGRLRKALAYTANGSKDFVRDLIDKHDQFNGWTVSQSQYVDQMLDRARENYRRVHGNGSVSHVSEEGMRGLWRVFNDLHSEREAEEIVFTGFALYRTEKEAIRIMIDDEAVGLVQSDGRIFLRQAHRAFAAEIADKASTYGEAAVREARGSRSRYD